MMASFESQAVQMCLAGKPSSVHHSMVSHCSVVGIGQGSGFCALARFDSSNPGILRGAVGNCHTAHEPMPSALRIHFDTGGGLSQQAGDQQQSTSKRVLVSGRPTVIRSQLETSSQSDFQPTAKLGRFPLTIPLSPNGIC